MFIGKYETVTSCKLVASSGASYTIELVKGDLRKQSPEGEVKCTHGVRIGGETTSHEWNFATKREACDYYGNVVGQKLYDGYVFGQ